MNQIITVREAAALAYASEMVKRFQAGRLDIDGIEAYWLDKEENRRFAIEVLKRLAILAPAHLMKIADDARGGWSLADAALRELILEHINRGEPLPTYLAAYNMEIVRNPPKRRPARQKADYFLRDIAITSIVFIVMRDFGMKAYGRNSSACSIVAEALGVANMRMSYKAVAEIWRKYGNV